MAKFIGNIFKGLHFQPNAFTQLITIPIRKHVNLKRNLSQFARRKCSTVIISIATHILKLGKLSSKQYHVRAVSPETE